MTEDESVPDTRAVYIVFPADVAFVVDPIDLGLVRARNVNDREGFPLVYEPMLIHICIREKSDDIANVVDATGVRAADEAAVTAGARNGKEGVVTSMLVPSPHLTDAVTVGAIESGASRLIEVVDPIAGIDDCS